MAEARAAVGNIRVVGSLQLEAIVHRAKLRGPQAHGCEGGLVVVFPSPSHLWRLALYKSYHTYNHFQRACWPAPVWAVILILTLCVSHVMISTGESWFRSGPVATWSVPGREDSQAHTFVSLAHTFSCKSLFFNSFIPMFAYVHQYLAKPQALERRRAIPWSARSVCIPPNLPPHCLSCGIQCTSKHAPDRTCVQTEHARAAQLPKLDVRKEGTLNNL